MPLHNDAGETNCAARGYFVLAAGVSAPGGLSGAAGALLSAGGAPLSGVVLPLVAEPEGSVGGGVLEPPQATAAKQPAKMKYTLKWERFMGRLFCTARATDEVAPDLLRGAENMRILVIGASKGTGAEVVKNALQRGHAVTAFARSPGQLELKHEHLHRLQGDFHEAQSVARAVAGHDAVIVTASATSLKAFKDNPNYFSQGTRHVIDAMKAQGVKRLSVLSAFGVGNSRSAANWFLDKLMISWLLKVPYQDHERQERLVMNSGLDFVIARPTRLTNGPADGRYQTETRLAPVPSRISRADVADFLVRAVSEDAWLGHAVQLGG